MLCFSLFGAVEQKSRVKNNPSAMLRVNRSEATRRANLCEIRSRLFIDLNVNLLLEIQKTLKAKSKESVKKSFQKFVPNSQNVYGVKVPELNELAKKYKDGGFELVELLWKSGAFEERLLAAKILTKVSKKDPERTLSLINSFAKDITDWAVCDTLGQQSTKPIATLKQKEIFALSQKWVKSPLLWERRLSLVLLESYSKDPKSRSFIMGVMKQLENDKEYYVKKAVEWTKRNLVKYKL